MPFKSKSQAKACYAKKAAGAAGSWDCGEWSESTNFKKLPEKVAAVRDTCVCLQKLAEDLPPAAVVRKSALQKVAYDLQHGVPLVTAIRQNYPRFSEKQATDVAAALCRRVTQMRKAASNPFTDAMDSAAPVLSRATSEDLANMERAGDVLANVGGAVGASSLGAAYGLGKSPTGNKMEGAAKGALKGLGTFGGALAGGSAGRALTQHFAPGVGHEGLDALGGIGGMLAGGYVGNKLPDWLVGQIPDRAEQKETAAGLGMPNSPTMGPTQSILNPSETGVNQPNVAVTTLQQGTSAATPQAPMSTVSSPATNLCM